MNSFNQKITLQEDNAGTLTLNPTELGADAYQWQYRIQNCQMFDIDGAIVTWRDIDATEQLAVDTDDFLKVFRCLITKDSVQRSTEEFRMNYGMAG
ncbi:hypothetical protein AB4342_01390 [Vibrio breoganii]